MAFGEHSRSRIAYVAEATFGVTPATPSFKTFRTTRGAGLRTNKATTKSDELRADRNTAALIQTGQGVSGDYPVELSYGTFDDLLEGALCGAFASNVLKNGVTAKSFTFEETRRVGATNYYSRFLGVMVNRLQIELRSKAIATATFGLMGQKEVPAADIVTGATYATAGVDPVLNTSLNVAALTVPNLTSPKLKSLSLRINNGLRERDSIGSLYSDEFGLGRCEVEGEFEAYFASNELYQAVLDHGGGALAFTIGAEANKKYTVALPNIVFGDGQIPSGGNTDDIMVRVPFTAVYDQSSAAEISITRAVA